MKARPAFYTTARRSPAAHSGECDAQSAIDRIDIVLREAPDYSDVLNELEQARTERDEFARTAVWATEALNVLGYPDYIVNQKSRHDAAAAAAAIA